MSARAAFDRAGMDAPAELFVFVRDDVGRIEQQRFGKAG
jgi:hypothetical protein